MSLTTNYLGLVLKNPLVVSSCPLSHTFDSFYVDYYLRNNTNSYAESLSYFPEMDKYNVWPDEYLNLIRRAKESVDVPIIGSLNGVSIGGWTNYASLIEDAGADALELNIYYVPTNVGLTGQEV